MTEPEKGIVVEIEEKREFAMYTGEKWVSVTKDNCMKVYDDYFSDNPSVRDYYIKFFDISEMKNDPS